MNRARPSHESAVLAALALALASLPGQPLARAEAIGQVDLDYSSFLYSSDGSLHPSSSLTLGLGLGLEGGVELQRKLDLGVMALSSDPKNSFTIDVREAYLSVHLDGGDRSELSLGQRRVEWNRADETWKLGFWSPRFVWDPLHPELVGKTGAFYHLTLEPGVGEKLEAWAQASPVGIPEHGFPVATQNGNVVAYSPFWTPPATLALYSGQTFPLKYTLQYPEHASEFYLRPNATFLTRYSYGGLWVGAGYSYGPMQRTVISVEPSLNLEGSPDVDAIIHPRFPFHHLLSAEAGISKRSWSFWGSVTREIPVQEELPSNWYSFPYGPSWIGALGASFEPARHLSISPSLLLVSEQVGSVPKYLASIPWVSRFIFNRAFRTDLAWDASDRLSAGVGWIRDLEHSNDLVSLDLGYRFSNLSLGIGADLLLTSVDQGFVGQYLGDDRVRWKVGYAF